MPLIERQNLSKASWPLLGVDDIAGEDENAVREEEEVSAVEVGFMLLVWAEEELESIVLLFGIPVDKGISVEVIVLVSRLLLVVEEPHSTPRHSSSLE